MSEVVDEVSVLRDAYWLGAQNADLCPEGDAVEIASRLAKCGLLRTSIVGEILSIPSYRLTPAGTPLAKQCYELVEQQRDELRGKVADLIAGAGLEAEAEALRRRGPRR